MAKKLLTFAADAPSRAARFMEYLADMSQSGSDDLERGLAEFVFGKVGWRRSGGRVLGDPQRQQRRNLRRRGRRDRRCRLRKRLPQRAQSFGVFEPVHRGQLAQHLIAARIP